MPKTVTLRLKDDLYELFSRLANQENRPLANFIETAALRHIQDAEYVDEFEMAQINDDKDLQRRLKSGIEDARAHRGRFIESV
jgi:predicted transcriptional regulator